MEIATGVVGLADVAIRAGSKVWKVCEAWRDAPSDLHHLCDDLVRAERFYNETRQGFDAFYAGSSKRLTWKPGPRRDLDKLLDEGKSTLKDIEEIVDKLVPGFPQDNSQLDQPVVLSKKRKATWLNNRSKVVKLRKDLHDNMSTLCRLIIGQNVAVTTELHTSIEASRDAIMSHTEARLNTAALEIASRVDQSIETSSNATVTRLQEALGSFERSLVSQLDRRLETLRTEVSVSVKQPDDHLQLLQPVKKAITAPRESGDLIQANYGASWTSFMRRIITVPRIFPCQLNCLCRCHAAESYSRWSMTWLRSVAGSIIMAYSSSSTQECTLPTCGNRSKGQSYRDLKVVYQFPDWLVRAALSIFVSSNVDGSPEMTIRVIYRLQPDSATLAQSIFGYIQRKDIDGVRKCLEERRACIFDVRGDNDESPLLLAVVKRNAALVKLLLQAGADPYQETVSRQSVATPVTTAFKIYLTGHQAGGELSRVLPVFRHLNDENYPSLHLAIIGVQHIDLAQALQKPAYVSDVNRKSSDGLSALHLAALRGNANAIKLLLRYGADIRVKTVQGESPLHQACRYGHYEAARILVDYGAPVNDKDAYGRAPLGDAALCVSDGLRILKLLVEHGADVHTLDQYQCEPLDMAVQVGTLESVRYLVENGANVNHRDWEGDIVLYDAIMNGRHDIAKFLLEQKSDICNINDHGRGILHRLASEGDLEMVKLFTRVRLPGLETTAKDASGKTPLMVLDERDPTEEFRIAFDHLLDNVERENQRKSAPEVVGKSQHDDSSVTSDDEFFDACDTWET